MGNRPGSAAKKGEAEEDMPPEPHLNRFVSGHRTPSWFANAHSSGNKLRTQDHGELAAEASIPESSEPSSSRRRRRRRRKKKKQRRPSLGTSAEGVFRSPPGAAWPGDPLEVSHALGWHRFRDSLARSMVLSHLSERMQLALFREAVPIFMQQGDVLFRAGNAGQLLFVVVQGALDVTEDGASRVVEAGEPVRLYIAALRQCHCG